MVFKSREIRYSKVIPLFLAGAIGGSMLAGCGSSSAENQKSTYPSTETYLKAGKLVKNIDECAPDDDSVGCVDVSIIKVCLGRDLETIIHTQSVGTLPDSQQSGGTDPVFISRDESSTSYGNPACADGILAKSDLPLASK